MKGLYLLTLGLALAAVGCGGSASSICNDICDCQGCNDNQLDECVDEIEDEQKAADDEGCGDQAQDLISCYGDELECRDSQVDLDGCDSEQKSLNNCLH